MPTGSVVTTSHRGCSGRHAPRQPDPHPSSGGGVPAAHALVEATCLHTARFDEGRDAAVVILTASEGLHTLTAVLGGQAHLRYVHDVILKACTCVC